jgi:hypothetical protein
MELFEIDLAHELLNGENKLYLLNQPARLKLNYKKVKWSKAKFFYFLFYKKKCFGDEFHNYNPKWKFLFNTFYVLVDSYNPSNFPNNLLKMFNKNRDIFISGNKLDLIFFQENNCNTIKISSLKNYNVKSILEIKEIRQILLALNCAGDWTALINRSDTDLLLEKFATLADNFKNYTFKVRLHPLMNHPLHEGEYSRFRAISLVKSLGFKNLKISNSDLKSDLKNSQIIISEYSNVLIESLEYDTIPITLNLTKRINFFKFFSDSGFNHFESIDDLQIFLNQLSENLKNTINSEQINRKNLSKKNNLTLV